MAKTNTNFLTGKIALITGGARRIGAGIAEKLHHNGCNLILHYHGSDQEAQSLKSELCQRRADSVTLLQCDLRDTERLTSLVNETINHLGQLDALINNASMFTPTALDADLPENHFQDMFNINVKAPWTLAQITARHLKNSHGAIINLADIYADRPLPGYALYCASRAAMVSLTRSLALELAPQVRVNAIAPGAILWPQNEAETDTDKQAQQKMIAQTPLKRRGSVDDIAQTVLFLLHEKSFITGQVFAIDGGRSIAIA